MLLCTSGAPLWAAESPPDLEVFVRAGCPHCEAAKLFLEELRRERPSIRIAVYDIAENPALSAQILSLQDLSTWTYYAYLGVYNLAYIFDDSLMVAIAVATLSRRRLQERAGRWLKLTSGLVMAGLGAVLLLQPNWLI